MRSGKKMMKQSIKLVVLTMAMVLLGATRAGAQDAMDTAYSVVLDTVGDQEEKVIESYNALFSDNGNEVIENVKKEGPQVITFGLSYDQATDTLKKVTSEYDFSKRQFTRYKNGATGHIQIDRVNVDGFVAPKENQKVQEQIDAITAPKSCGYTIKAVLWKDYDTNKEMSTEGGFATGKYYMCYIQLEAQEGFAFSEALDGYINNSHGHVNTTNSSSEQEAEIITGKFTSGGTLTKFNVKNLPVPKAGGEITDEGVSFDFDLSPAAGDYGWMVAKPGFNKDKLTLTDHDWFEYMEGAIVENAKFEDGKTYIFPVMLFFDAPCKVDRSIFKPTVNGKPVIYRYHDMEEDGIEIVIFYVVKVGEEAENDPVGSSKPAAVGKSLVDETSGNTYIVTNADEKAPEVVFAKTDGQSRGTEVTVPANVKIKGVSYKVTAIAPKAFKNNIKLKKITIGNNIKTIGAQAFYGCVKLKTVSGGKGVETIGALAFKNCKALTKFVLYTNVKNIGKTAFSGCKSMKVLNIKTKLLTKQSVHKTAFKKINKAVKVTVPKSKKKAYKKIIKL